jgi:hypothetical protein
MECTKNFCVFKTSVFFAAIASAFVAFSHFDSAPREGFDNGEARIEAASLGKPAPVDPALEGSSPRRARAAHWKCETTGQRRDIAHALLLAFATRDPRAMAASCKG